MNDRITLTMQDILEKEFKIDARGYRPPGQPGGARLPLQGRRMAGPGGHRL